MGLFMLLVLIVPEKDLYQSLNPQTVFFVCLVNNFCVLLPDDLLSGFWQTQTVTYHKTVSSSCLLEVIEFNRFPGAVQEEWPGAS